MRLLLAGLLVVSGLSAARAVDLDALYAALDRGDTAAMTGIVETLYTDAGISVNDSLSWDLQPYDYTFNYYDQYLEKIVLGSIPARGEVDAYWDNWSKVLTGGSWQRTSFFQTPADAAMLGAYNAFVIAVHELGHGVTYRYDPDQVERDGRSVNCRELYADRYAASITQQVAAADPRFAALRTRYVEVMASMNAAIAEKDRYHLDSLAALDANCDIIHVEQPTPETLQPYASAYFERLRLLFGADMPPAAELAKTWLEPRRLEFMVDMPYGDEAESLVLTTLATIPDFEAASVYDQDAGAYAAGFDLAGQLYFGELLHEDDTDIISFSYGPPGALAPVVTSEPYLRKLHELQLTSLAPISADKFFALFREWQETRTVLVMGERTDGKWTLQPLSELDDMPAARIMQAPDGTMHFLASVDPNIYGSNDGWDAATFDATTLEPADSPPLTRIYGLPLAIRADGRLLTYAFDLLLDFGREGTFFVLAGNHLPGSKDADDPRRMEVLGLVAAQELPDGRILLLDTGPTGKSAVIRELKRKSCVGLSLPPV